MLREQYNEPNHLILFQIFLITQSNIYFPNPRKHTNIVQCYFLIFLSEKVSVPLKKTGLAVSA